MYSTRKNNKIVGYLLGTLHVTMIDVTKIPKIMDVVGKCNSLWLEINKSDAKKLDISKLNTISKITDTNNLGKGIDIQLHEYFDDKKLFVGSLESNPKTEMINQFSDLLIQNTKKFEDQNKDKTNIDLAEILTLKLIRELQSLWLKDVTRWEENLLNLQFPSSNHKTQFIDDRDKLFAQKMEEMLDKEDGIPLFAVGFMHISGILKNMVNYEVIKAPGIKDGFFEMR